MIYGHVPQIGLGRVQDNVFVANPVGELAMVETHHPLKSRLNDKQSVNMLFMFVAVAVFHPLISALNDVHLLNIPLNVVTLPVFHPPIYPLK